MSGPSPTSLADKQHLQRAHCPASRPAFQMSCLRLSETSSKKNMDNILSKDGHASVFWLLHNVHNIWCPNQHTGTSPKPPAVPMHNPTLASGMEKIGKLMQTFDAIRCHYQSLPIGHRVHISHLDLKTTSTNQPIPSFQTHQFSLPRNAGGSTWLLRATV